MSKMNKAELYTLAKQQKEELMTSSLFNNSLEEEIEELKLNLGGMTCDRDKHEEEADNLFCKNSRLKEENEKLKEDKKYIDDISDEYCKKWNEELKENEKLKEEKFNYNVFLEEKNNMIIMINELKEKNELLQKEYIEQADEMGEYHHENKQLEDKIEEYQHYYKEKNRENQKRIEQLRQAKRCMSYNDIDFQEFLDSGE